MTDPRLNGKDGRLEPLRLIEAHEQRAIWFLESNFQLSEDHARRQLKRELDASHLGFTGCLPVGQTGRAHPAGFSQSSVTKPRSRVTISLASLDKHFLGVARRARQGQTGGCGSLGSWSVGTVVQECLGLSYSSATR